MKKIAFTCLYITIVVLLFVLFQRLFYVDPDPRNSAVWDKLQIADSTSDILVMGNSQAYTSLDADTLSNGLGLDVNILATNAQSMEMCAANLRTLLRTHRPGVLLLEASVALTPTHDRLQGAAVDMVYANIDGIHDPWQRFMNAAAVLKPLQLPQAMLPLQRPTSAKARIDQMNSGNEVPASSRGTDLRTSKASSTVDDYVQVKTDEQLALREEYSDSSVSGMIDEYNTQAFAEYCQLAAEAGLEVLIYKSPYLLWDAEYELRWQELTELASSHPNVSILTDGCAYMPKAGLETQDFYDGEHLNQNGAEKFTRYLGGLLADRSGLTPRWGVFDEVQLETNQCLLQ